MSDAGAQDAAQQHWHKAGDTQALTTGRAARQELVVVGDVVRFVRWWLLIGEAARNDMKIRLKRWRKALEGLRFVKAKMQLAWAHKQRIACGKAVSEWVAWSATERSLKATSRWLYLKRGFVHRWRVDFMGVCARLKRLRDKVRFFVDPEAAAKLHAFDKLQEPRRLRAMNDRADLHLVKTSLLGHWRVNAACKKALQGKIDRGLAVSAEYKARLRFWAGLQDIMRHAAKQRRAASAFTMAVPRRALNAWVAKLAHVREGQLQLLMLAAHSGDHLPRVGRLLAAVPEGVREDLLLHVYTCASSCVWHVHGMYTGARGPPAAV